MVMALIFSRRLIVSAETETRNRSAQLQGGYWKVLRRIQGERPRVSVQYEDRTTTAETLSEGAQNTIIQIFMREREIRKLCRK